MEMVHMAQHWTWQDLALRWKLNSRSGKFPVTSGCWAGGGLYLPVSTQKGLFIHFTFTRCYQKALEVITRSERIIIPLSHTISKCFNYWFTWFSSFWVSLFLIPNFTLKTLNPLHFPFLVFLPLPPDKSSPACNLNLYFRQISKKCLSEPFKCFHIMWESVDAVIKADFIGKQPQPICVANGLTLLMCFKWPW